MKDSHSSRFTKSRGRAKTGPTKSMAPFCYYLCQWNSISSRDSQSGRDSICGKIAFWIWRMKSRGKSRRPSHLIIRQNRSELGNHSFTGLPNSLRVAKLVESIATNSHNHPSVKPPWLINQIPPFYEILCGIYWHQISFLPILIAEIVWINYLYKNSKFAELSNFLGKLSLCTKEFGEVWS